MTALRATLWVADRRARPQGLIADLRRRHGQRSIARLAPAAAARGSAFGGARLAILDLRSGSGLDRAFLPEIAAALLAHGCAALMLADEAAGGAVAPAELAATYRAAVVATQAVAASRARLARTWMPAAGRPALATTLADSRVLGANAELLALLGIERLEALLGRPLNAFLAEPEAAAEASCGASGGSSPGMEVEIWRRGGERVPALRFSRTLRRPRSATVVGCEVAFVELPAASAVRRALAASEQRYRRLVDSLPDGVVQCDAGGSVEVWNPAAERIFGLVPLQREEQARHRAEEQLLLLESVVEQTREGILVWQAQSRRIVYVNPAVLANTGYRREELLGQPATILLAAAAGSPEAAWIEGRVDQGEALHAEIPCRMANGTTRLLDLRIEPLRGSGGEITHWAALGRDRTAHKAAEEERDRLRETISRSLLEWHQTFDSIALPVLLLDARGAVGRLNEAARQLAGRSFAECLQEPLDRLGRGEPWATAARLTAAVRRTGTLASRGEQCTSDGRTWEIRAQPLPTGGGIIVTLHDLSDLVALQESLRRSATMSAMGMLVAGVAHEVRNPLFGLGALLDTFESQAEPRQPFPVEPFRRGLTRLQNLMQQLLDYGQPAPLSRSPHSLFKTLAESLDTCRSLAAERQVDLALCADPRLPMACIDESRMLQVFSNLVDNAIRYSPRGGRVTVSAAAAGQWVECDVEDAGPGVAAEDLASIFEPFFSRRRGGTGLGLAIVQKIVVDHGGTIACHGRDGGGTRMSVRLPMAAST